MLGESAQVLVPVLLQALEGGLENIGISGVEQQ